MARNAKNIVKMRWNKEQDQRLVAYICSKQLAEFQTTADLYAEFLAENTHYTGLDMAAIVRRVSRWKRGWLDLKDDRPQSQSLKADDQRYIENLDAFFSKNWNRNRKFFRNTSKSEDASLPICDIKTDSSCSQDETGLLVSSDESASSVPATDLTVNQRIFIIQCYYKGGEKTRHALRCLQLRHGARNENLATIQAIVDLFESTGSVLEPAESITVDAKAVKFEKEEVDMDMPKVEGEIETVFVKADEEIILMNLENESKVDEVMPAIELLPPPESPHIKKEKPPTVTDAPVTEKPRHIRKKVQKECPDCGKLCRRLLDHRRVYHPSSTQKYICKECGTECPTFDSLRYHRKSHLDPVICEFCSMSCLDEIALRRHQLVHTKERPFSCPECPLRFKRIQGLTHHKKVHLEEKPLACEVCGKRFRKSCGLHLHMRKHTGERPYPCKYCDKKYSGKATLNCHYKLSHPSGEYSNECGLCGNLFKTTKTLQEHMEKRHGQSVD